MVRSHNTTKNIDVCNPAELLSIMSFYLKVEPTIQTPRFLKISGFNIAGLRGGKQGKTAQSVTTERGGHNLAWHETLGFGICTCFKWIGERWTKDITIAQHGMHKRLHKEHNGN